VRVDRVSIGRKTTVATVSERGRGDNFLVA
jgi:hypothetical protein